VTLWTIGFIVVVALFALAIFARWRMLREERRRPGYVHDVSVCGECGHYGGGHWPECRWGR
jgi:hypothetical protein